VIEPGRIAFVVLAAVALAGCGGPAADVTLHVATDRPVAIVDDRFLSVAVDSAQLVGGEWWDDAGAVDGMQPVPPFDFGRARLRTLAAALAPFYLRVGGTDADRTVYALGPTPAAPPVAPDRWTLTAEEWNGAVDFARALDAPIVFTLNAGPAHRGSDGGFIADGARTLLAAAASTGAPVAAWELGNEINGYPVTFLTTVSASTYVADLATARTLVDGTTPGAKLAGPASAYWPIIGELGGLLPPVVEQGGGALDLVTWHYYPQQGRRCSATVRKASLTTLLDPDALDEVDRWSAEVESAAAAGAPHASLWLGETGNAQCGGEAGVSDAWASSLWWADELGKMARRGTQVVVRQSLTGANYGLLAEPSLDPRPDYFTSVLWKRLVGPRVLDVAPPARPTVRAYAHCAMSAAAPPGAVTVVLVNLEGAPVRVALGLDGDTSVWTLDAASLDAPTARLGGVPMAVAADGALPLLPSQPVRGPLVLPPQSVTFALAASAGAVACK
jgi:heparanase